MVLVITSLFALLSAGFAMALFPFGSTVPPVTLPTGVNAGDIEKGAGCSGQSFGELLQFTQPTTLSGTIRFNCGTTPAILVTITGTYLATSAYVDTNLTGTGYKEIGLIPTGTGPCTVPSGISELYYKTTGNSVTFTPTGSNTTLAAGSYDYCASFSGTAGQILPTFSIDWYH